MAGLGGYDGPLRCSGNCRHGGCPARIECLAYLAAWTSAWQALTRCQWGLSPSRSNEITACERSAMPGLLAWREPHHVTGPNLLDRSAFTLGPAAARRYNERLT